MKKLKIAAIVALTAIAPIATTTIAYADDLIERQAYQDPNFETNRQKAIAILSQKGYQVTDVDVDTRMGKAILEVEAYKNHQEYNIKMSYPSLQILSEAIDD